MNDSYPYKGHSGVLAALPQKSLLKLWYIILIICIPFSLKTVVYEDYILLTSFFLFVLTSRIYLYALIDERVPPISVYIPLIFMGLTQSLGVYYTGVQAIYWAYPIVISFYFVVSDRPANLLTFWLVIQTSFFLYLSSGISMSLRFLFSMIIVCSLVRLMIDFVLSLKDELVALSIIDPLTGAYNRRHMDDQLKENISERSVTTLVMIDIDHFKKVNDTYGHDVGDEVLKSLVSCLKAHSRDNDQVFRMGGEEFVMLLGDTNKEQAKFFANKLRKHLSKLLITGTDKTITVSMGVSELLEQTSYQDWLKQADLCLYQAKSQGRDRVVVHG